MIIDGKLFQEQKIEELKNLIQEKDIKIKNAVIVVGNDPASEIYVRNKITICAKVGIQTSLISLDENVSENKLLNIIDDLNNREDINGILVQLPLPKHISEDKVARAINPNKDIDCFNPYNIGNMVIGNNKIGTDILPCTPMGILMLLEQYNIDVVGKKVVVVGRSNIVGKPISILLTNKGATVTVCHSKTKDLIAELKTADIAILAIGKAKYFKQEWFKQDVVIIDVGINRQEDNKVCGDFDIEKDKYKDFQGMITPVPNGVGRSTIVALMYNSLSCYYKQNKEKSKTNKLLELQTNFLKEQEDNKYRIEQENKCFLALVNYMQKKLS